MNRDQVKNEEEVGKELADTASFSQDEAIGYILNDLDADVVVPHMFCYPGYTSFRSLFDMLDIPYLGTAAEI